jgi:type II secretion system protein N
VRGGLLLAGAALALTSLFVLILFPYGNYRAWVEAGLAAGSGARVSVADAGGSFGLSGPALRLSGISMAYPDGLRLELDEVRVRPALSFSWLSGDPALHLEARGEVGELSGTCWLGERPGFDGSIEALQLEALPLTRYAEGLSLSGLADLEIDLRAEAGTLSGDVELDARDGSVAFPPYGVPVPFAHAYAEASLSAEGVSIETLSLEDEGLRVEAEGSIGPGARGALDLRAELEVSDPALRSLVGQAVPLNGEGRGAVRLAGSLARPVLAP